MTDQNKPIKVICFLFDPNIGGPTIRARSVYTKLVADGYDVRMALPDIPGTAAEYLAEMSLPVDRLPIVKPVLPRKVSAFLKFVATAPVSLYRVWRYLRKEAPDVIHVNGAFDVIPAIAGKLSRTPVVWHLNDTIFGKRLSGLLGRFVRMVADVVVVAATRVGEHYDVMDAKPHVIFAPVDVRQFQPVEHQMHSPPKATFIGNWNWIKGQDRFVQMISVLRKRNIPVQGQIVGKFLDSQEGYWAPIVQDIKDRGMEDVISTPGFSTDMVGCLAGSDVFVLTSHSEASPISLLEAMAMGVPVATFDVGGVVEMLGADGPDPAGIVVSEGDVEGLADAVQLILENTDKYAAFSRSGRQRAVDNYSLDACIQHHKMAYTAANCINEKKPI